MPCKGRFYICYIIIMSMITTTTFGVQRTLRPRLSLNEIQPLKRSSGFVRIGRQGNFIRIGRSSILAGVETDDGKMHMPREYIVKEQMPGLGQMRQWYLHSHRNKRVACDGNSNEIEGNRQHLKGVEPLKTLSIIRNKIKCNNRAKKSSSFLRIGRLGDSKMEFPFKPKQHTVKNQETPDHGTKKDLDFTGLNSVYVTIPQEMESTDNNKKNGSYSNLALISKLRLPFPQNYDDIDQRKMHISENVDNDDKLDKKESGFIRIGKSDMESLDNLFEEPYTNIFEYSSNRNKNSRTPEARKIRSGNKSYDNGGEHLSPISSNDRFARATGIVYWGNENNGNRSPSTYIPFGWLSSNINSQRNDKTLSNLVNTRRQPFRISDSNSKTYQQEKRSSSSFAMSPGSFKSNVETAIPDSPLDAANRRSAFVRIGKIPSSAFVRIGKNFDRVFQLPVINDRHHQFHIRKGHSSFVRIG